MGQKLGVLIVGILIIGIFGLFYFLIKTNLRWQLASFSQKAQVIPTPAPTVSPIEKKLDKMSLEEKIGCLFMVGFNGVELNEETQEFFKKHHFNAFLLFEKNVKNQEQLKKLINFFNHQKFQSFLPLIAVDQEGGRVNRLDFPTSPRLRGTGEDIDKTSQAEIKTTGQAYQVAKNRGEVLEGWGINMNFSPVVEIVRDKSSYINLSGRAFFPEENDNISKEQKVASLAGEMVRGYREAGIIAVLKHFPGGLGRIRTDPHLDLPVLDINKEELEKDIFPFRKLIKNDSIQAVMVTHILYPQIDESNPSSLSKEFISRILRGDLGFGGLVISDDLTMAAITKGYSIVEASKQSFLAGADLILISGYAKDQQEAYETLLQAVKDGEISEQRIDQSIRRIIGCRL